MDDLQAFENQQYLNLETFRRTGVGVKTPVWFVRDGDTLFVRTIANSGKVKRIRNRGSVKIAPCKVDGALLGEWQQAEACEVKDEEIAHKVDRLLGKKYGLMKTLFAWMSALQRRQYSVLKIKVV